MVEDFIITNAKTIYTNDIETCCYRLINNEFIFFCNPSFKPNDFVKYFEAQHLKRLLPMPEITNPVHLAIWENLKKTSLG